MIIALKSALKIDPQIKLLKLFFIGFIICSVPEMVVQVIQQILLIQIDYIFIEGFWGSTFIFATVVFFISYQLRTKNTGKLFLLIISFIILFNVVKYFYPDFLNYR